MQTRRFAVRGRGSAASQAFMPAGSKFAALSSLRFDYCGQRYLIASSCDSPHAIALGACPFISALSASLGVPSSASLCRKPKSRTSRARASSRSSRRFMFSYPHSHVRLPLASLPIYQMARGASSSQLISPRFRSTDQRLSFTINFEPISCTLAPQPKHAENRSVKLLLSTPKRSKNFIFLLFLRR